LPRCGGTIVAWGLFIAVLWAAPASAQGVPQQASSALLFEDGIARTDRGDWSGAAERFRASLRVERSDRTAFNLARALTALGEVDEAGSILRAILENPGSDLLIREAAAMLLDEISPRLAAPAEATHVPSARVAARASLDATTDPTAAPFTEDADDATPVTERWWFWTGAGAIAVAAVVVGVLVATGGPEPAQGDVGPIYLGGAR
jgi:hypothetical protein